MTDILRRNRSPPPSPRSVRNIHIYTRDSRKQGVSSPYLGPPTSPHRSVSSIIEPVGKMQQKEDSSKLPGQAGRPPNALPTHDERGSNISTQRATCRHRRPSLRASLPAFPSSTSRSESIRQDPRGPDRGILASVILPNPTPYRRTKSCFPRFCQYRFARDCPMVRFRGHCQPGVGDQAGTRTASHGRPHAQSQNGFELVSAPTDWPCELRK